MSRHNEGSPSPTPITWERLRRIFGYPQPVCESWERQFDGFDEELKRLAATSYDQIEWGDLWYYHLDLAYAELQPDLFRYLFPACLMDWHLTMQADQPCSHGDADFHLAVLHGNIFERMLDANQRDEVFLVFRDSFLERIDRLDDLSRCPHWLARFNSLGYVMPRIDLLWNPWWSAETLGRARAIFQFCSGLIYGTRDNPLLGHFLFEFEGRGLPIWADDADLQPRGWLSENIEVMMRVLTVGFVERKIAACVRRLENERDLPLAIAVERDLPERRELIEIRLEELPELLTGSDQEGDWSL